MQTILATFLYWFYRRQRVCFAEQEKVKIQMIVVPILNLLDFSISVSVLGERALQWNSLSIDKQINWPPRHSFPISRLIEKEGTLILFKFEPRFRGARCVGWQRMVPALRYDSKVWSYHIFWRDTFEIPLSLSSWLFRFVFISFDI